MFSGCSKVRANVQRLRRTGRTQQLSGPGAASAVRLSKIDDYLADNFCVLMLSEVTGWVQEQTDRIADLNPNLGIPRKGPGWRPRADVSRLGMQGADAKLGHRPASAELPPLAKSARSGAPDKKNRKKKSVVSWRFSVLSLLLPG